MVLIGEKVTALKYYILGKKCPAFALTYSGHPGDIMHSHTEYGELSGTIQVQNSVHGC